MDTQFHWLLYKMAEWFKVSVWSNFLAESIPFPRKLDNINHLIRSYSYRNSPAMFPPASALVSNIATVAPSSHNLSTVALPIPEAPPDEEKSKQIQRLQIIDRAINSINL